MYQIKEQDIPKGSIIGVEGGPLVGKTLFSLNLFPTKRICHVDMNHLDHYVYKNQRLDIDIYRPAHKPELVKFIQENDYDVIILDSFTRFSYTPEIFQILMNYINKRTDQIYIIVFDNLAEYDKLLFKGLLPYFNLYFYLVKEPSLKYYSKDGLSEYIQVHVLTVYRLLNKIEPQFTFHIDLTNNQLIETAYLISYLEEEGGISKKGNSWYIDDKRISSYEYLYKYITNKHYKDSINE